MCLPDDISMNDDCLDGTSMDDDIGVQGPRPKIVVDPASRVQLGGMVQVTYPSQAT